MIEPGMIEPGITEPREKQSSTERKNLSMPDPSRFCPTCSTQLVDQQCKLKCPQCAYYLSCSDFY
jgi:hypothetical protein